MGKLVILVILHTLLRDLVQGKVIQGSVAFAKASAKPGRGPPPWAQAHEKGDYEYFSSF